MMKVEAFLPDKFETSSSLILFESFSMPEVSTNERPQSNIPAERDRARPQFKKENAEKIHLLKKCDVMDRIFNKIRNGICLDQPEGQSLHLIAINIEGGDEWFRQTVPGWGETNKDNEELDFNIKKKYKPPTCSKLQEMGLCKFSGNPCLKSKKSPIAFVYGAKSLREERNIEWGEVEPFDSLTLPELPVSDVFPDVLADFILDISNAFEVPKELPGLLALMVVSSTFRGKIKYEIRNGYCEQAVIWVLVGYPSGGRKTPVSNTVREPIEVWEWERKQFMEPIIREARSKRESELAYIKSKRSNLGKIKTAEERQVAINEIAQLELNLEPVPGEPRVLSGDTTPARLAMLMAENNGALSTIDDEGEFLRQFTGKNGESSQYDLMLKMYDGSPYRQERVAREDLYIERALGAFGVLTQPCMIEELSSNIEAREKGVLARFTLALPKSNLGYRTGSTTPIRQEVVERYNNLITELLNLPGNPEEPTKVTFSDDANARLEEYFLHNEKRMRKGGVFELMTDYGGKTVGRAARIAGAFHFATYGKGGLSKHIEKSTVDSAIKVVESLVPHAIEAYNLTGANPTLDLAVKILDWIKERSCSEFEVRECWIRFRGGYKGKSIKVLEPALSLLVESAHIHPFKRRKSSVGKPKNMMAVNPAFIKNKNV